MARKFEAAGEHMLCIDPITVPRDASPEGKPLLSMHLHSEVKTGMVCVGHYTVLTYVHLCKASLAAGSCGKVMLQASEHTKMHRLGQDALFPFSQLGSDPD